MSPPVRPMVLACLLAPPLAFAAGAAARTFVVDQRDRSFGQAELVVHAGDTVRFTNSDPYFHSVFSTSRAQPFDLGAFPGGASREVTLTVPGTLEVRCGIHPSMLVVLHVRP